MPTYLNVASQPPCQSGVKQNGVYASIRLGQCYHASAAECGGIVQFRGGYVLQGDLSERQGLIAFFVVGAGHCIGDVRRLVA